MSEDSAWAAISAGFGDAVRDYHAARGTDPQAARVASTVRTNTDLVPQRAATITSLVEQLTDLGTLRGRQVLEVGSGFGALAAYLAWRERPASLLALDVREDFVASARQAVERGGLKDRLTFRHADMRDLTMLDRGRFDVAILNNAFVYLPTAADMDVALEQLATVLRPGGWVLMYHANRWRYREPFTGDPLIHLVAPRFAPLVSRATGWRGSHGRVRLLSAPELRRRVRRAGFEATRIVGFAKQRRDSGWRRNLGGYYALAARRSPGRG